MQGAPARKGKPAVERGAGPKKTSAVKKGLRPGGQRDPQKQAARGAQKQAREAEKKRRMAQQEAHRRKERAKREEKRRLRRKKRQEARQVRAARRRARRLAFVLGSRQAMVRLGRLVWPEYTRKIPPLKAVVVFVLNVVPFPGLGTVIYGKWERGLVQFLLTFVFLIGWLWAVTDGIRVMLRAFESDDRQARLAEVAARRRQ